MNSKITFKAQQTQNTKKQRTRHRRATKKQTSSSIPAQFNYNSTEESEDLTKRRTFLQMKEMVNTYISEEFLDEIRENNQAFNKSFEELFKQGLAIIPDTFKVLNDMYFEDEAKEDNCIVEIFKNSKENIELQETYLQREERKAGYSIKQRGGAALMKVTYDREEDCYYTDKLTEGIVIKSSTNKFKIVFMCSPEKFRSFVDSGAYLVKYNCLVARDRCIKLYDYLPDMIGTNQPPTLFERVARFIENRPVNTNILDDSNTILKTLIRDENWRAFQSLNLSQKQAVEGALLTDSFYLIHGPPGTGKSETLTAIVEAIIRSGKKVLVCSEANNPVDNLLSKIVRKYADTYFFKDLLIGKKIVRLGNSWLVDPSVKDFLMSKYLGQMTSSNKGGKMNDIRSMKSKIYQKARAVFSTQCSTYEDVFFDYFSKEENKFDYLIIDEASQSFLAYSLMAISLSKKVIFAGDHLQLPPVIKGKHNLHMEVSLFEQLVDVQKSRNLPPSKRVYTLLNEQYRMNHLLMEFSSNCFYDGNVRSGSSNKHIQLSDLQLEDEYSSSAGQIVPLDKPLIWIDHKGEESMKGKGVIYNQHEAELVLVLLKDLLVNIRIPQKDVGIIVSYNSQREKIMNMLDENKEFRSRGITIDTDLLMISTVDSFQGREKEVIIYASTRSNKGNGIGFLKDQRRLNVALTRAKRCLIFIGNSDTLTKENKFITKKLYTHVQQKGYVFKYCIHTKNVIRDIRKDNYSQKTSLPKTEPCYQSPGNSEYEDGWMTVGVPNKSSVPLAHYVPASPAHYQPSQPRTTPTPPKPNHPPARTISSPTHPHPQYKKTFCEKVISVINRLFS